MSLFPVNLSRESIAEKSYLLAFFSLVTLWAAFAFSPALVEIASVTGLIGWILWRKFSVIPPVKLPRTLLIPLALFVSLSVLSVFFSEYPSKSFRGIFKILQQVMVFFLAADVFSRQEKRRLFEKVLLMISLVVLADGVFQYFAGFDFLRFRAPEASGAGVRLSAGFGTYGKLAAYLVCLIPFLTGLGIFYHKEKKRLLSAVSVLTTFGFLALLFLTRSRGAFLGLFAGVFLVLLFTRKFRLLVMFLALTGAVAALLPHNMVIHLDAERKEQSIVERYYLWDRAVNVIKAKPLTGTGINTYAVAHQKYDKTANWRVKNYYAHNGYLQMAAETGIPALLCFLWFLTAYFLNSFSFSGMRNERPLVIGLAAGILNFLIFAAVDTLFHSSQPMIMLWFLCGWQASYHSALKNKLDAA